MRWIRRYRILACRMRNKLAAAGAFALRAHFGLLRKQALCLLLQIVVVVLGFFVVFA